MQGLHRVLNLNMAQYGYNYNNTIVIVTNVNKLECLPPQFVHTGAQQLTIF